LTIEKTAEVDEEHRCSRLVCEAYTRAPSGDEPHALCCAGRGRGAAS
jgi:hypothetical protein